MSARWTPLTHQLRLDNKTLTDFPNFPGDAKLLEVALSVPYSRGKVWIPQLKIWFTIENDDQVLLKAITIAPDDDPIF